MVVIRRLFVGAVSLGMMAAIALGLFFVGAFIFGGDYSVFAKLINAALAMILIWIIGGDATIEFKAEGGGDRSQPKE